MPTILLLVGWPFTLLPNVVYALPAKKTRAHSTAPFEISPNGIDWDAITAADTTGVDISSAFIRSAAGAVIILNA